MNIPSVAPLNAIIPVHRQTEEKNNALASKLKKGAGATISDANAALLMRWKDLRQQGADIRKDEIAVLRHQIKNSKSFLQKNKIPSIADMLITLQKTDTENSTALVKTADDTPTVIDKKDAQQSIQTEMANNPASFVRKASE